MADWGNDRVQKFSTEGKFLMSLGLPSPMGDSSTTPSDVAVDSEGDVYVTDWGNNRVQIYYPDGDIITVVVRRRPRLLKVRTNVV